MPQLFIERTMIIDATPARVWSVLTEPEFTRRFGGEFVTEWSPGSSFSWKGLDGRLHTHGVLTKIEPGVLFQYDLFHPNSTSVVSTITYELHADETAKKTTLLAREEFTGAISKEVYDLSGTAWVEALARIKGYAEE